MHASLRCFVLPCIIAADPSQVVFLYFFSSFLFGCWLDPQSQNNEHTGSVLYINTSNSPLSYWEKNSGSSRYHPIKFLRVYLLSSLVVGRRWVCDCRWSFCLLYFPLEQFIDKPQLTLEMRIQFPAEWSQWPPLSRSKNSVFSPNLVSLLERMWFFFCLLSLFKMVFQCAVIHHLPQKTQRTI